MTYPVTGRGVGRPDYSNEVSRSIQRAGIDLKANQTIKGFGIIFTALVSPFSWFAGLLGPGLTAHMIDTDTGLVTPYTLPQGYTISLVQDSLGFTEQADVWIYYDTFPVALLSIANANTELYRNRVFPFSTKLIDPGGLAAHQIDFQVTNNGLANMGGSVSLTTLIEAVGTPPLPDVKTVQCKHCSHTWEVPNEATELICPACGKLTIVYNMRAFKRSG